jgi:hypothetical protein
LAPPHRLRHHGDKAEPLLRGQRPRFARTARAIGHQERFAPIRQVLAQLGEMDPRRGAGTALPLGDMPPQWEPLRGHREPKEPSLEGGPVSATIATSHARSLLIVPLVGLVSLERGGIGVQAPQLQGIPVHGVADHDAVQAIQAGRPPGLQ